MFGKKLKTVFNSFSGKKLIRNTQFFAKAVIEENEKFNDKLSTALAHLINNISDVRTMAMNVKSLFPENSSDIILENISELHEKYDNSAS